MEDLVKPQLGDLFDSSLENDIDATNPKIQDKTAYQINRAPTPLPVEPS